MRPGPLVLRSGPGLWILRREPFYAEVSTSMLQRPKRPQKARMPQRKPQHSRLLQSPPKVRLHQLSPPGPSPHCSRLSLSLSYSCSHTGSDPQFFLASQHPRLAPHSGILAQFPKAVSKFTCLLPQSPSKTILTITCWSTDRETEALETERA